MTKSRELTDLTACRALFALWVFAYHLNLHTRFGQYLGPLGPVIGHGYLGVDGFFVLSGLILARVNHDIKLTVRGILQFWGKRLARIYPVHLAVIVLLGVLFVGGIAYGITPREPERFSMDALIAHLLLVQGWGVIHHWAWNYPSWSISTEWAGYLVFPFAMVSLTIFYDMAVVTIVPLCIFIICIISFFYHGLNLTFGDSLLRFFPEFFLGASTAIVVPMLADEVPGTLVTAAGAVVALIFAWSGHDAMTVLGLWLMLYGFGMQGDAERPAIIGGFRPLHALGVISYCFYMCFAPAELMTSQLFRHMHDAPTERPLAYAAVLFVLTLGLAIVLHFVIERPSRIALNRRLDPARATALAEGSVPL
ncbi:MAG TPA: acyltransferase [Acidiphilium sp.]